MAAAWLATRYEHQLGSFAAIGTALLFAPIGWGGLAAQINNALPAIQTAISSLEPHQAHPGGTGKGPSSKVTVAPKAKDPPDYCFNKFAYQALAGAPRGLTLSEIDLGPFVLAYSPSSSLSGPYHRLSWGIMAARGALIADADHALPMLRKLGVTYVLACPLHRNHADRTGLSRDSLQRRLDRGDPPAWLRPMTQRTSPVVIYQVRASEKTQ